MLLYFIGFVFLLLFLYPYIFYPAILKLIPKKPYVADVGAETKHLKAALVFCAYNEEESLPGKIKNCPNQ